MEQLGADLLLVCSNVSEAAIDDDALAAAQLHALAERAAEHGIRIAYEALAWGRHVRDYDHAWRIVEAGDHPNLGTCLDSFHILSRGADPRRHPRRSRARRSSTSSSPTRRSSSWTCCSGAATTAASRARAASTSRRSSAHVLAAGYAGPLSLEVFNDVFRQADPARMAVDAMRSLLLLEEAAGVSALPAAAAAARLRVRRAGRRAGGGVGRRAAADRDGLPPRGPAPHEGRPAVAPRRHPHPRQPRGPRRARARGWRRSRSRAPTRSAPRSAPSGCSRRVLPRDRGPDEADLSAIAAPDGTSVFFCRTDAADAESWLADFLTAGPPGPDAGAELAGIDHVALSQPFDYFDEAALFYRSVLGLELAGRRTSSPRPTGSCAAAPRAAPTAACASRSACRSSATAAPSSSTSRSPATDIFAAARAMRDRGVPLLAIPGNYYDDLAARTELDPALIERMRELGVLYDAEPAAASSCTSTPR